MNQKYLHFTIRLIGWLLLTLFRASVVVVGYLLYLTAVSCEIGLSALATVGNFIGVTIKGVDFNQPEIDNAPLFTKSQIEGMAETLPKDVKTVAEIADHLGVSFRQARKIKAEVGTPLSVHNYQLAKAE